MNERIKEIKQLILNTDDFDEIKELSEEMCYLYETIYALKLK